MNGSTETTAGARPAAEPVHTEHDEFVETLRTIRRQIPASLEVVTTELHYMTPRDGSLVKLAGVHEGFGALPVHVLRLHLEEARRSVQPSVLRNLSPDDTLRSWIVVPIGEDGIPTPLVLFLGSSREPGSFTRREVDGLEPLASPLFAHCLRTGTLSYLTLPEYESLQIIETLPDPVLVTNGLGCVVAVNSNFRFCFGEHSPLLPGCALESLLPETHAEIFRDALRRGMARRPGADIELPPLGGVLAALRFRLSTSVFALGADGERLVVFSMREVTAGSELSIIREREGAQERMMQTLIHDLRTPVAALIQGSELLAGIGGAEPAQRSADDLADLGDIVQVIRSSAEQVQQLLGDLDDFVDANHRVKTGNFALCSLAQLAGDVLEVWRLKEPGRALELLVEQDSQVLCNRARLRRALDNLVSNAVKYSPAGTAVTLRVRRDWEPGFAALEVIDLGQGIAPEFLGKIWEPFYRVPAARKSGAAGTGLGLSIVRSIAEAHCGRVEVDSTPGQGSTFRILLPKL